MMLKEKYEIKEFFQKLWVNHAIFWIFLFIFLLIFDRANEPISFVIIKELINLFFFGTLIYINLLYLIPRYLEKNKFISYFFFSMGMVGLLTPIKVATSYLIHFQYPDQQSFLLNNQYLVVIQLIFVTVASMIFSLIGNLYKHQIEKKELQEQNLTSELKFLKSQIDPHFFFNTLNSLYALSLKKSDKAPEIVLKLSEIMRYMLYECNGKTVPLEKEVQYLQNYIDLEKIRHGKDLKIKLEVNGDLLNKRIMPLVFTPFIENSFKHGVNNSIEGSFINLLLNVENEALHFEIENSKGDALQTINGDSGGIGLTNVIRRLSLEYPNDHNLVIDEKDKTYKIELQLKLTQI